MTNFPSTLKPGYKNLCTADLLDKNTNVSSMKRFYYGATNLVINVIVDTSKVTDMNSMFYNCSAKSITEFDTSKVTDMSNMFYGCSGLTSIPQLDTSNVTNMSNMFYGCSGLTSIPQLDTSNVTTMYSMFRNCSALTSIPQLDTSNLTSMGSMFLGCSNLRSIPQLDTSKVISMSDMFSGCAKLTVIPQLDCSSVTNIGLFGYNGSASLTTLGGFPNLGKQSSVSYLTGNYFLGASSNLTKESIMNVINGLYDRKSAGMSVLTLKLHANVMALLSDEEKAIATNKGWSLS